MRVLGLDCGSECTGYGVIETDGIHHRLIECGQIRLARHCGLPDRLVEVAQELRQVIGRLQPQVAAVEGVFTHLNHASALKLAHVRGVAIMTVAEAGIEVMEFTPQQIKNQLSGYGRASKEQIRSMVALLLHIDEAAIPGDDASDALAVALCCALRLREGGRR